MKSNTLVGQVVGIGVGLLVLYVAARVVSTGWNAGKKA